MKELDRFRELWFVDFEFGGGNGERQSPLCLVAYELGSQREMRVWEDDLLRLSCPPYNVGTDSCFFSYYLPAELKCHLVLNWKLPLFAIDLYVEFRNFTNGKPVYAGNSLLGALEYFGVESMLAGEKQEMQQLALRGRPYTEAEKRDLLEYCAADVHALIQLFHKLIPHVDINDALLRGTYMRDLSVVEDTGVPIDMELLKQLRKYWKPIELRLIEEIDDNDIWEDGSFRRKNFERFLIERKIPWPRLNTGTLDLKNDTFRQMAKIFPEVSPIHELRSTLGQMRLEKLAVGSDGRNRCLLSGFKAKTSRNLPSSNEYVFGPATWVRSLIRPQPDHGVAYLDYAQQEWAVAAVLSGDNNMIQAYESGDPYITFAHQAGAVPEGATKESHTAEREQFKVCALAVNYGQGYRSLSININDAEAKAKELLFLHRKTYPRFWEWSDNVQDYATLHGKLWTVFRWYLHVIGPDINPRSLRNFPVQANAAEMLRLAVIEAVKQGVRVCGPVHDALLIESPLDGLNQAIAKTRAAMVKAGRVVLNGFELRVDVKPIRWPARYTDRRGARMWNTVMELLAEVKDRAVGGRSE
jgi:hypothetical protein